MINVYRSEPDVFIAGLKGKADILESYTNVNGNDLLN